MLLEVVLLYCVRNNMSLSNDSAGDILRMYDG